MASLLLPSGILAVTLGVVGGIAWLTSRLVGTDTPAGTDPAERRPCTATVRSISDAHMMINDSSAYQVRLRIQPEDGAPAYDATVRDTLTSTQAGLVHPGATFHCLVHPDDRTRIEVLWSE